MKIIIEAEPEEIAALLVVEQPAKNIKCPIETICLAVRHAIGNQGQDEKR